MKKHKKLSALVALISLLLAAKLFANDVLVEEQEVKGDNSRFKVFIAEYNTLYKGKTVMLKSIFKIDLQTGTVWRYRQGVDNKGKPFEEFFEVPNQ